MSVDKIFILLVFNGECIERNVMTSFRSLSSFKCFYVIFQQNDHSFLPFSVNCSKIPMFQVMPVLRPYGQGEWDGERWSTKC